MITELIHPSMTNTEIFNFNLTDIFSILLFQTSYMTITLELEFFKHHLASSCLPYI